MRLDQVLASLFSDYSRSRLQQWIRDGFVKVAGQPCRAKDKVQAGQQVGYQDVNPPEDKPKHQHLEKNI